MKKSLLALAVLASFAGAASAQSSVTVYGLVDAGITHETGAVAGSVTKVATGVENGNRLGFKGTEDLGNGLKAIFQIESGFNLDTGTSRQGGALFGRQAFVGLSGNFGTVALGRQYNPLFVTLDSIDPFGTGLTGASTNLMAATTVRTNNAVTYATPDMNGFSATGLYGAGEQAAGAANGRTIGLSGAYANGPVMATVAYDKANNITDTDSTKLLVIGGTYNFGPATAHLAYETEKTNATSFRDILVGVSAPVSASGTVIGSFIKKSDRTTPQNEGAKQFALGYIHALSKRTQVYTSYAHISNDSGTNHYVGDASNGGVAGGDVATVAQQALGSSSSGFTVGLRHKF